VTTPRRLATIVALDVAGYSARTEADEERTTAEVAVLRGVIESICQAHGGRVFNTAGDGFMLEFSSSLAAVEAALALAEKCEPKVRVGVHVGDVMVQPNGDLLGHGVNVAARLMARSDPGAALVSADVKRLIRGPLAERLASRGVLQLDKMAETVEAFSVATVSTPRSSAKQAAEPTLVVLPFDNLSNDPELQFFSDGVSEEIIQALTRGSKLRVIGRSSAFQFRGDRKGDAAATLKATHVLDGSVRRSGTRMRVTAQLTGAESNTLLWTDRYERNVADAFELQDDIAAQVTAALKHALAPPTRAPSKVDPVAYDLYLRARAHMSIGHVADFRRAEELLAQAASRAPDSPDIWSLLAFVRTFLLPTDHDAQGEPLSVAAQSAAERALALDPKSALAMMAQALLGPAFAAYDEKQRLAETAYHLAPNDPLIGGAWGGVSVSVGRAAESLAARERAAQLDPLSPRRLGQYSNALSANGHRDKAIAVIHDAWARLPHSLWLWIARFQALTDSGLVDEAMAMCRNADDIAAAGMPKEFVDVLSKHLAAGQAPMTEREKIYRSWPGLQDQSVPLDLTLCMTVAVMGLTDFVVDLILAAVSSGRRIETGNIGGGSRASTTGALFDSQRARALHQNPRFPLVCARLGLVDYWQASGRWPDCATQVSYDFKGECANAARQLGGT
jgi:adenylate cyclase